MQLIPLLVALIVGWTVFLAVAAIGFRIVAGLEALEDDDGIR